MLESTARQWLAWRDDYWCSRPLVSCRGCGRHYKPDQSAAVMVFIRFELVSCSNCDKPEKENPKC